jgi:hypothetical protein
VQGDPFLYDDAVVWVDDAVVVAVGAVYVVAVVLVCAFFF